MRLRARVLWRLAAAAVAHTSLSSPGSALADAQALRWSDVVKRLDEHPAIAVSRSAVQAASAELTAQTELRGPEVEVRLGRSFARDSGDEDTVLGIEAGIDLPFPPSRAAKRRAARLGVEAAQTDVETARRDALVELRGLFVEIAFDQELQAAHEEAVARLDEIASAVKLRVEKGEARPIELSRIQAERGTAKVALARLRGAASSRRELLGRAMGLSGPVGRVELDVKEVKPLPTLEDAMSRAAARDPYLRAARLRSAQADAAETAAAREAAPSLRLGGYYERELDVQTGGAIATVSLPFLGLNAGERAKANAAGARATADQAERGREIERRIASALGEGSSLREALADFDAEVAPYEASSLSALEHMYRIGEVGLLDLLDARRSGLRRRIERLELLREIHLLQRELDALTGDLR